MKLQRSALDHILSQLDKPDATHCWSREDIDAAREELRALRAENARLREALLSFTEAGCPCSDCTRARTALASKEDRRG